MNLRRNDTLRHTPAEKAIHDAILAVEAVGAHTLLTDAVVLLAQAKERVSDYVDRSASSSIDRFAQKPDGITRHGSISSVLKHFRFEHLPPHLQEISRPCGELALKMADALPENPELTVGLRKLLEAKDCFVRARL